MTSSVNRRISDLENKVLKPFKLGTTKLLIEDEAEAALFDRVRKIGLAYNFDELTEEQMFLFDKAMERLWLKAIDIFCEVVGGLIHHDDPLCKLFFYMWLGYFVQEASTGMSQRLEEDRIFDQKGKTWKQKEKEAKHLYKNWVKIFTRERFERYMSDLFSNNLEHDKKEKKYGRL